MSDERNLLTLVFDENDEEECEVLTIFEVEDQEYIALEPLNEEIEDIYLYRYSEGENGEALLDEIETDEEYSLVVEAFESLFEDEEEEE
ncbi:MAG: DUF1292 domain-containing protein [Firmicutes bacterium]|nr:DUF1292 domain-containing protein [Bacillota bacterium]